MKAELSIELDDEDIKSSAKFVQQAVKLMVQQTKNKKPELMDLEEDKMEDNGN
jgi:mannose/fructose/N-acetylgalactosamine-specific phosphotransferase system component IIB